MKEDVFILGAENIVIISVSPCVPDGAVTGYYEYEFTVLTAPNTIKKDIIFEVIFIKNRKVCVTTSIISRTELSNDQEKVIFIAASPLYYLSLNHVERSWVNKSIYEVLLDVLSPIASKKKFMLQVGNNFTIKFLYQDHSYNSLKFLHKILEENSLILCTSYSENMMLISIDGYVACDKGIEDLSPICLCLKENISPLYSNTEKYTDKSWRIYECGECGAGINKVLRVTTDVLNIKAGEVYIYNDDRYVVNNTLYCFRKTPPYDLVLTLILICMHNKYNHIKDLKKSCLGFAISKYVYRDEDTLYVSSLLNENDNLPMPITEVMTARQGAEMIFSHTYKKDSNMFMVRIYNTNKLIALPGAYDLNNASALTSEYDAITQSDTGKILASDNGVEFQINKSFNKFYNDWEVKADNISYKATRIEENNIENKNIKSNNEITINADDSMHINGVVA